MAALPALAVLDDPAPADAAEAAPVRLGTVFALFAGPVDNQTESRFRLARGDDGAPCLEPVPRRDWPELRDAPQPVPASVHVGPAFGGALLERTWADGDAGRCTRCRSCTVFRHGETGRMTCFLSVPPAALDRPVEELADFTRD